MSAVNRQHDTPQISAAAATEHTHKIRGGMGQSG